MKEQEAFETSGAPDLVTQLRMFGEKKVPPLELKFVTSHSSHMCDG